MPELPEVETIRRGLEGAVVGREVSDVDIRVAKMFHGDAKDVIGAKIVAVKRHAKMLEIDLSNNNALLIHLKMTGQLVFDPSTSSGQVDRKARVAGGHPSADWVADLPNKFTHVIFHFKDGSVLFFNDLRKFGYIKLFKQDELANSKELKHLGPSPFDKEFNEEYLMRVVMKRPRIKIKQILLDQTIIAGIGNIYADESLFCAGISPLRLSGQIKRTEFTKLISCIKKVLEMGLKYGGSSENTFVNIDGQQGQMQNHFQIYRKTGLQCPNRCGIVKRTVVGGRGTHYCPACQR